MLDDVGLDRQVRLRCWGHDDGRTHRMEMRSREDAAFGEGTRWLRSRSVRYHATLSVIEKRQSSGRFVGIQRSVDAATRLWSRAHRWRQHHRGRVTMDSMRASGETARPGATVQSDEIYEAIVTVGRKIAA